MWIVESELMRKRNKIYMNNNNSNSNITLKKLVTTLWLLGTNVHHPILVVWATIHDTGCESQGGTRIVTAWQSNQKNIRMDWQYGIVLFIPWFKTKDNPWLQYCLWMSSNVFGTKKGRKLEYSRIVVWFCRWFAKDSLICLSYCLFWWHFIGIIIIISIKILDYSVEGTLGYDPDLGWDGKGWVGSILLFST